MADQLLSTAVPSSNVHDLGTGHSTLETALYDDPPGHRGLPQLQLNSFFVSGSESACGCLRIHVVAGSDLEATLGVGQTPFLYGIGRLQKAKRSGKKIDSEAEQFLFSVFDIYSKPEQYDTINPWDPLLFLLGKDSKDEQKKFYSKVWRLHMNFDLDILVFTFGQGAILRLVEPHFEKLEIDITVDFESSEGHYTLTRDEVEGSNYKLSLTSPGESQSSDEGTWSNADGYYANGGHRHDSSPGSEGIHDSSEEYIDL